MLFKPSFAAVAQPERSRLLLDTRFTDML